MNPDILQRREKHFVLWRAKPGTTPPRLLIGRFQPGAPASLADEQRFDLSQSPDFSDLWLIPAAACNLTDGEVYHYWFEVDDTHPDRPRSRIHVTDPLAFAVDWRLRAPRPAEAGYSDDDRYPAAVVKFSGGSLVPSDPGGETGQLGVEAALANLPANNRLVLYELPTAWARTGSAGERESGVGTFRDVLALLDPEEGGAGFSDLAVTRRGRAYLAELGVTGLELLPPADSFYVREWGYGTTNFFAPDFELGFPGDSSWPTPNRDLRALIAAAHGRGIRFFVDVVMAFAKVHAYLAAATDDFFILHPRADSADPDAHDSRGGVRNGFGSTLFRYAAFQDAYDPVSGEQGRVSPARQLMKASLLRWMNDFHVDGIRVDSVENVANWDFLEEYKDLARETWRRRSLAEAPGSSPDERFLVVGEELNEPLDLLRQHRLDGLWHENFKRFIRAALLGQIGPGEPGFESTVRKAIDCRGFGYGDMAEAVIYLTSHDVEGFRNERLCTFFRNNGVGDVARRCRLAFVCLLTAVGVPMILAGDEFADEHDLFDAEGHVSQGGGKQVDPVNFSRLEESWRSELKDYVSRLIKLRTTHAALAVNDTEFIHSDVSETRRVLAWRRGRGGSDTVVVVANFSDFGTADPRNPSAEYRVPNWPTTPPGMAWREVTQERDVPAEWVGREPIYPWEAKVYVLRSASLSAL